MKKLIILLFAVNFYLSNAQAPFQIKIEPVTIQELSGLKLIHMVLMMANG